MARIKNKKMTEKSIKSEYIIKKICEYFNVPEHLIFSQQRRKDLVEARHYSIYYMYHYGDTGGSPSAVRDVFKNKGGISNHATIIYAVKRIEDDLSYSLDANRKMLEIDEFIGISKRKYLTIHYFMDVNKGHVISMGSEDNSVLWKHESIQRRGSKLYLTGEYKHAEHGWLKSDNKFYDYGGYLCTGLDAERVFENNK